MRCKHCQNPMNLVEEVIELRTRQTWFECPLCERQHTVAERTEQSNSRQVQNGQRYSAGARLARGSH